VISGKSQKSCRRGAEAGAGWAIADRSGKAGRTDSLDRVYRKLGRTGVERVA